MDDDGDLADLYEHAPCGQLSTTADGLIVRVNETFARMTGYERTELVGKRRFEELLSPGGRIYHETHYAPMLRLQGTVRELALDLVRPDGERVPVLVNAALRADAGAIRIAVFGATERRRYEDDLLAARDAARISETRARDLAATLQATFIPPDPPQIAGLDVAAAYRPAGAGDEVGGDFYDVFETGRHDWAVVIGDVCGKGTEAAAVTAVARYTVRAAAMRSRRPRAILAVLNDALLRQGNDLFCTALYTRVRLVRGTVRVSVSAGGHWLPIRVSTEGTSEIGKVGTVLGIVDRPQLQEVTVDLQPGEALVHFTDGIVEARRDDDQFGHERLLELLHHVADRPAAAITQAIVDAALAFQDDLPRDDMAVVVVRVPPEE